VQVSHRRRRSALLAATAAVGASAVAPAAADAVSLTVTGDDGNPVALGAPVSIRYLNPDVTIAVGVNERYGFSVTGPNNLPAAVDDSCATNGDHRQVNYAGNGTYTVTLRQFAPSSTGTFCSSTQIGTTTLQFTINAGVAIDQAPAVALTRKPLSPVTNTAPIHVVQNPGGISNQFFYGFNTQIAPDGSLVTPVDRVFPDPSTGQAGVPLNRGPGVYAIVGRAEGFNIGGDVFTAWSAPAQIRAFAPFDFKRVQFPDQRGPSYRLRATMNENATSGRVSIAVARGSKGGRYRSLGSVKISGHAISKRFRLTRTGTYRIRFKYKGNALVAPGFVVEKVRITKRIFFRGASLAG
jgi:hypothetical protein